MSEVTLPDNLLGNWIWSEPPALPARESHVLFRREFTLSETPALAELWISCHTHFNLYINEQHVSFGPSPSNKSISYAQYLNITYLLQTGKNAICIQANNVNISRFGNTKQENGLWCQINIDDDSQFSTDGEWSAKVAEHMTLNQFRISSALGFVESQDLRKYDSSWNKLSQSKNDGSLKIEGHQAWDKAFIVSPINEARLLAQNLPEFTSSLASFKHIAARGTTSKARASISVEFHTLAEEEGTYVAHSFFHSDKSFDDDIFVHCDDSYKLFFNGKLVNSQGDKRSLNGADPTWLKPLKCLEGNESDPHGTGHVVEGWNSLIIIMYCDNNTPGITINFSNLEASSCHVVQDPIEDASFGWKMAGPLKIPFSHISGLLNFDQMEQFAYHNLRPTDNSAYLMSLDFAPSSSENEPVGFLELYTNDYIILDAGKCLTGSPVLTLAGNSGDQIDIIYGELCQDGKVIPLHSSHGRKVDSIILSNEEVEWSSQSKRSFRYLGIHMRDAKESCFVKNPGIRIISVQEEMKGKFSSNDEILNGIYQTSLQTLESCTSYNFASTPSGDNCQYIADAAIQAMTSFQTLGTTDLSRKALLEFMLSQFETGEMPGACPSDIYFNIPDYPLHWVKWLQKHLLHTDDHTLLEECLECLVHLLDYYDSLAIPEYGVLGSDLGNLCFLDHDDIDRRGVVTGLNALYCRALLCAAWIFDYANDPDAAKQVKARAAKVSSTMRELTWDEERGLFADCYVDGEKSTSYTMQTNTLALYGALADGANYQRIFDNVFIAESPYIKLPTSNRMNPYFNYFILETAFSLNRREWAGEFIKWYWGDMLKAGASTWWEFYNPLLNTKPTINSSTCHGYGVSPNIYIYSDIVGIRPAAPGFKQIYFNPMPGTAEWVKSKIPTPHGYISVDWATNRDGGLDIEIKSNYELDVISQLPPELVAISTVHVSEEVNIISDLE